MRVVERKEVVVRHVRQNFVKKFVGEIHEGPLLITEAQATTWVPEGFRVHLDRQGNLILEQRGRF